MPKNSMEITKHQQHVAITIVTDTMNNLLKVLEDNGISCETCPENNTMLHYTCDSCLLGGKKINWEKLD